MKPIIGITPSPTRDELAHGTFERYTLAANYANAVLAAGGAPVILPPQGEDTATRLLDSVDGVILSGGGDVEPAWYGDDAIHPQTYGVNPLRDRFERSLITATIARDLPMLCICRGIQVLNVALGGTLFQDVPDQLSRQLQHRQQALGIDAAEPSHTVSVSAGSLLEEIFGQQSIRVNSYHHQAINALAPGLAAIGHADDGLIEAVSLLGKRYVLGVQWHPELMFERHPEHLRPFSRLVESAKVAALSALRG